jgi:hypothetical protein
VLLRKLDAGEQAEIVGRETRAEKRRVAQFRQSGALDGLTTPDRIIEEAPPD